MRSDDPRLATLARWSGLVMPVLFALQMICWATPCWAQTPKNDGASKPPEPAKAGVSVNDAKAYQGYTLIAPMNSTKTYLLDMEGRVVRTWESDYTPALCAYLLDNGHLLRPANPGKGSFGMPGAGGKVQEFDWDGKLVWDYTFSGPNQQPHHDITRLPNGNVLMIVSDRKSGEEAAAAGRRPGSVRDGHLSADAIVEIKPTGKTSGEVVWEWHVWDHLVQEDDKTKANYGKVASHPELVDVNFGQDAMARIAPKKDDLDKLRGLGYLGGPQPPGPSDRGGPGGGGPPGLGADWTHVNAVAYNPDLDQIVLSVHAFSEVWVIDHGATKEEAAGHKGGRRGKGGDLLYRWGNPRAYRSGTNADQRLFNQHNAHWIPKGLPGEGHLLVFNNGGRRPDGSYSSVDEIVTPVDPAGNYARKPGLTFGPDRAEWSYTAPNKTEFFAMLISGAQRLPNGNTLICSGPDGTVFEVTPGKDVVWKFAHPNRGLGGPGGPGGRFGGFPAPGQVLPTFLQDMLRFTPEQKKQVEELQKDVDARIDKLLTDDQRKQLKAMREGFGRGPMMGFGPPGGMGPGGPGGLFRSYRYGADHPALAGKELKPGKKLADMDAKN